MPSSRTSSTIIIILILLFSMLQPSYSDEGEEGDEPTGQETPSEVSEELGALLEQQKIAEAEAAISKAESEKAASDLAKSKVGGSDTGGNDGTATVGEGAGYFSEVLAYKSVDIAAEQIFLKINKKANKFIITNRFDLNKERALWRKIELRLNIFDKSLKRLRGQLLQDSQGICPIEYKVDAPVPEAIAVLGAITAGLGALADIASFFKVDTKLQAYNFSLNDMALIASLAGKLTAAQNTVFMPTLHADSKGVITKGLDNIEQILIDIGTMRKEIQECSDEEWKQIQALEEKLAEYKKAEDTVKIKETEKKIKAAKSAPKIELREFAEDKVPKAQKAIADFNTNLTTPIKEGDISPIEAIATVDAMKLHTDAFFIYADIISEGGEVEISKSVWTGGRVSYIGGNSSVFFLTKGDGEVVTAGTETTYLRGWYGNRGGVKGLKLSTEAKFLKEKNDDFFPQVDEQAN